MTDKDENLTDPEPLPLTLREIIDIEAVQSLMNHFFSLTGIGIAILDTEGNVLVATGWQEICTRFHRVHPQTARNCLESDIILAGPIEEGTYKLYKCKNNMWDMATPIEVDGRRVGNLFLGQFFFDNEDVDRGFFRRQARHYGFDETEYLAALDKVPRWSRKTVNTVMAFYTGFTGIISSMGHNNLVMKKSMEEIRRLSAEPLN